MADAYVALDDALIEELAQQAATSIAQAHKVGQDAAKVRTRQSDFLVAVALALFEWHRRGLMDDPQVYPAVRQALKDRGVSLPVSSPLETAAARLLMGPNLPRERYCRVAGAVRYIAGKVGNRDPREFLKQHGGVSGCYQASLGKRRADQPTEETGSSAASKSLPMPSGLERWVQENRPACMSMVVVVDHHGSVSRVIAAEGPRYALVTYAGVDGDAKDLIASLNPTRTSVSGEMTWTIVPNGTALIQAVVADERLTIHQYGDNEEALDALPR